MITESEYDCGMLKDMLDWSEQIKKRQTCGMNNIDCGKAGYKTDQEIELEKKLEIAVKALEEYANEDNWCECIAGFNPKPVDCGCYGYYGFQEAQEALAKIKEIK